MTGRVGWRQYPASFPFALTDENKRSDSGRFFQDFSALATLSNIKSAMEDAEADENAFNEYLSDMQRAAIATVLSGVLRESRTLRNFDDLVEKNIDVFDEAIGLQVAISAVELMSLSVRSNSNERATKDMSSTLYRELNGLHADNGAPVTVGLKNRISREIATLKKRLFPKPQPVISTPNFT